MRDHLPILVAAGDRGYVAQPHLPSVLLEEDRFTDLAQPRELVDGAHQILGAAVT